MIIDANLIFGFWLGFGIGSTIGTILSLVVLAMRGKI